MPKRRSTNEVVSGQETYSERQHHHKDEGYEAVAHLSGAVLPRLQSRTKRTVLLPVLVHNERTHDLRWFHLCRQRGQRTDIAANWLGPPEAKRSGRLGRSHPYSRCQASVIELLFSFSRDSLRPASHGSTVALRRRPFNLNLSPTCQGSDDIRPTSRISTGPLPRIGTVDHQGRVIARNRSGSQASGIRTLLRRGS